MPVKKAAVKKKSVSASKEMSWDQIGKAIGQKIEKESKKSDAGCCTPWSKNIHDHGKCGGHFFGALLFGIILAVILNQQGILLDGVSWWLQVLLVFGWSLMWA